MKTQFSHFYADRKSAILAALTAAFVLFIPFGSLVYGLMIYGVYLAINLIAVLPALTVWQAMMLAVPFAAARLVFSLRKFRTFAKMREILKDAFACHQKLDALRR